MTLARLDAARDENETVIVEVLRRGGASVHRISAKGVPDLLVGLVGRSGRGETHLIEVKGPLGPRGGESSVKLTPAQAEAIYERYGNAYGVGLVAIWIVMFLRRKPMAS